MDVEERGLSKVILPRICRLHARALLRMASPSVISKGLINTPYN